MSFRFHRLILISHRDRVANEFEFEPGLNIVVGANDTGKSGIIKSLFVALGCDVERLPLGWNDLVDTYIVVLGIGQHTYTVMRLPTGFYLYEGDPANMERVRPLGSYDSVTKGLSPALVGDILNIRFRWLTKQNIETAPSLAHFLSFSYIDQDRGWTAFAESFGGVKYVTNWKETMIKYLVGYQDDRYFELVREIQHLTAELRDKSLQKSHYEQFVKELEHEIATRHGSGQRSLAISYIGFEGQRDLAVISNLERQLLTFNEQLAQANNEHRELSFLLTSLKKIEPELADDHEFAMSLDAEVTCPFCGTIHKNDLRSRSQILRDIDGAEGLITETRGAIADKLSITGGLKDEITKLKRELARSKKRFAERKENMPALLEYKVEGKLELLDDGQGRIDVLQKELGRLAAERFELDRSKKKLESPDRRREITASLAHIFNRLLSDLDVQDYVKVNKFLPSTQHSGSRFPRVVFAYHMALFLYNLKREHFPFKLLIVDTPNQNGQDEDNLKAIYSVVGQLAGLGQSIVASERLTGNEPAAHVIVLHHKRRLLTADRFLGLQSVREQLLRLATQARS